MKFKMVCQKQTIAEVDANVSTTGMIINNACVIDEQKLPLLVRFRMRNGSSVGSAVNDWIKTRMVPNSRRNLDRVMAKLLSINQCDAGRMFGYQFIASLISGFTSVFDGYSMVPENDDVILVRPAETDIATLLNIKSNVAVDVRGLSLSRIMDMFIMYGTGESVSILPSMSFSIQSSLESAWFFKTDLFLRQIIFGNSEPLNSAVEYMVDNCGCETELNGGLQELVIPATSILLQKSDLVDLDQLMEAKAILSDEEASRFECGVRYISTIPEDVRKLFRVYPINGSCCFSFLK